MAFTTYTDIGNRALQHCGRLRLNDLALDASPQALELREAYDKVRLSELQTNLWTFSTREAILRALGVDSVIWTPPLWVSGSTYSPGAVVQYTPPNGPYRGKALYWRTDVTKTTDTVTPELDADWHLYTGPLAIDLWNPSTAVINGTNYQSGEVVLVPPTYAGGTTYAQNDVVNYGGNWYVSLISSNTGHQPDISPTDWVLWTSQGRGNGAFGVTATGSPVPLTYPTGYAVYLSLFNNNSDNPTASTGNWLSLGGTITPLRMVWPAGSGPFSQVSTKNAYRLPNGFLRRAPTDPKGGQMVWLGAESGVAPEDWVIEGKFIVSHDPGPIVLRFVADVIDVPDFDALFAEAFSASLSNETAAALHDDLKPAVFAKIERHYKNKIGLARAVNSIEVGPIFPVENRYVTVRR